MTRDEILTQAYIDGRNAARDGKVTRYEIPAEWAEDTLAAINWETGYDDWLCEQMSDTLEE